MKRARFRLILILVVFLLVIAFGYQRLIPSGKKIFSSQFPEGCASCHTEKKGNSLTESLQNIKDHPPVEATSAADCAACHEEGSLVFSKGIHRAHYQGQNKYEDEYNGACVNCHKLSEQGDIIIPGLAPQGTKYVTITATNVDLSHGGCAGCHKQKYAVLDYNLKKMVNKLPNHPKVDVSNFNQCYDCHGQSAPELAEVLHVKHLKHIVYQKLYGNSCLNCHELKNDGSVIVKGKK